MKEGSLRGAFFHQSPLSLVPVPAVRNTLGCYAAYSTRFGGLAMISAFQEIDIHGMNREQAFAAIDARLRRSGTSVYTLRVIHGYHGGTVLQDAIRAHYKNHPKVIRIELGLNPGETDLILREL